jgi:hypothetical protein
MLTETPPLLYFQDASGLPERCIDEFGGQAAPEESDEEEEEEGEEEEDEPMDDA